MQSFEFVDLILFLGVSQGVFLAITLLVIKNTNKAANAVLSAILLLSAVMLLGRMIFFKFLTLRLYQWSLLIDVVIFLFGPLTYMYVRRLAFYKNEKFLLSWQHYTLSIIHVLYSFYVLSLSPEVFGEMLSSGALDIPFFIIEVLGIVSNMYYCVANFKLIQLYSSEEKNAISYRQNVVSFLRFFQITIAAVVGVWVLSFVVVKLFDYQLKWIDYNTVWGATSIFIYIVGYYSLKEPELFRLPLKSKKTKPKPKQRLSTSQVQTLEKVLQQSIQEEKIFLKSNLTLRDLSERLGVSTHDISWYLNTVAKCNFYDYINQYRVKEFLRRVENNEHHYHTILALSIEAGFNSKSTFNKAFKLEMNDTPRNYIRSKSLEELV